MNDIEKRARELLERHTVAINVAVEDGSCFMVSEQDALDAIREALTCAASPDSTQTALPPLPPVDGYDKRVHGHYSAEQMRSYARAALTRPDGYVLVPVEPTEAQWGGLARDVVMWMECYQTRSADSLLKHLRRCGTDIPKWLMEEVKGGSHSLAKGTVAAVIYKAMLADRPEVK